MPYVLRGQTTIQEQQRSATGGCLYGERDSGSKGTDDLCLGYEKSWKIAVSGRVSSHRQACFEQATRSLATFVRSHHSLSLHCPAPLHLFTPFTGSLTHFAHSLVGQLKILNMRSRCYGVSREGTRFWRSLETRPHCGTAEREEEPMRERNKVTYKASYAASQVVCGRAGAEMKLAKILLGQDSGAMNRL